MGPLCRYIGRKISSIIHSPLLLETLSASSIPAREYVHYATTTIPYTTNLNDLGFFEHNLSHHSLFFRSECTHYYNCTNQTLQSIITSPVMKCTYYENTGSLYTNVATPCYCQIINHNYCFIIHTRDRTLQLLVICKVIYRLTVIIETVGTIPPFGYPFDT